ncbi:MAG TPA: RHS repeat-associated core domain-containing protein [Terriglobales bacterium]|jgi:RHS repeat-associated protein|nr:RHS repeat-associated core domain-containing protein [Terriglobales bacterium]
MRDRFGFAARLTIVLLLAVWSANDTISAQVTTGIPPFSSITGGQYDTINLANLTVLITIPVRSKAVGPIPMSFALSGNSDFVALPAQHRIWAGGFSGLRGAATPFLSATTTVSWGHRQSTNCANGDPTTLFTNWSFSDQIGTFHSFPSTVQVDTAGCITPSSSGVATDGSGYTLVLNALPTLTSIVYDVSGNKISNVLPTGTVTDPDGNQISITGKGCGNPCQGGIFDYNDALSQTLFLTATLGGGQLGPDTYVYTDAAGGSPTFTVGYYQPTQKTNFTCLNIAEVPSIPVYYPSSVTLPDNSSFVIGYEPTPGGPTGDVTGRIASLKLPTGGTISYSYSGGNNGINCSDGTVATLQRSTPDGTWTYTHTPPAAGSVISTTSVKDPAGNETDYTFAGIYETLRVVKDVKLGVVRQVTTCYNGNVNNGLGGCQSPGSVPTLPIFQTDVYTWAGMTPQSLVETKYDKTYGLVTSVGRWDWGAPIPPTSLNLISTTYTPLGSWNGSGCVAVGNYINDHVCYKNVNDGSGALQSSETFNYSPQGHLLKHVAGTTTSGINGPTLTSQASYNSNGTVNVVTDVNNSQSTYHYDGSCNSLLPTSVSEPLSLSRSMTWDCNGGAMKSSTDENNQPTTAAYADPLWRITSATNQGYPATNYTYSDPNHFENYMNFNGSVSTVDTTTATDGLGRPILVQKRQGQGSSSFDSVQYQYGWNTMGAFAKQSLPYSGSPVAWTTTQYDALGRPSTVTDGGGGTVTYTYKGNDVVQTLASPSVSKQLEYDGLGRLTSVCEITTGTGYGTCLQTNHQNGYWTTYLYNALGRLTSVTQNAQGSPTQTRNYYYDGLGRLTKEINPESGTTQYFWDAAPPICYNNVGWSTPGDLGAKLDANGVYTCNGYDGLHRLQGYLYRPSSGCGGFIYDSSTPPAGSGISVHNTLGRLVETYTNNDCNGTQNVVTDRWLSYSTRGEVTDIYSSTPHSGGYYHLSKSYWANGVVNTLSGIPGVPTITYGADGEGRTSTVSAGTGQNPVTQTLYNPASQVTSVTFGSGDSDTYQYDASTGRMTQYTFAVNGQSVIGKPTWNSNGTLQKFQVTQDPFNSANVQTCTYGFDGLARVNSVGCGSTWAQTFSYDPFGNITKSGSSSWMPGYDANNHYTLGGTSYDADGNLKNDTFHTYQWDANGHVTANDSSTFTYDAVGNMAEASWGDQYLYDTDGKLLAGSHSQASAYFAHIPLPGWGIAGYGNGSLTEYKHGDWLGSVRFSSTSARALNYDLAFAPYGEPYASSHIGNIFASMEQVEVADEYDTHFREYHATQGRWISPDPSGLAAADPTNPQTWNRYAYVTNNPLSLIDPFGTDSCPAGQSDNCVDVVATAPSVPTFAINLDGIFPSNPYAYNGARGNAVLGFVKHLHWPKIKDAVKRVSQCAAPLANTMAASQLTNGTPLQGAGNVGLTNDLSTLSNLAFGPGQSDAAIDVGISKELSLATRVALETPVDTGGIAIGESGGLAERYFAKPGTLTQPLAETLLGKTLGLGLRIVSEAKGIYDAGIFLGAAYVCRDQF